MTTATYSAGTAYLSVVPSFLNVEDAFRRQVRDMAQAADKELAQGMARGLREANKQARDTGKQGGKDFAGAYAEEARRALDKAWRSLPEPQPGVNLRKWDKALAGVRADMKELSQQRIGIDIDRATFDKAIADFRRRVAELRDSASGQNAAIGFYNADQAAQALTELDNFNREAVRRAEAGGEQAGSAFTQRMSRVLQSGIGAVPEIEITADSSDAERALAELRARMVALQDQRIGIDVDAGAAYAELRAILAELERLDRRSVRVDIRTNAHEAASGLGQFVQQAERAGSATEALGVRANFSMSRLEYLIALGASLGTSIVPAALSAAAAVGTIGTSAIAAMAGIGVFALGISGVSDAVKALNKASQDQAKSGAAVEQANQRISSSTNQVRMAQMALSNTRRNVAEAGEDAARRVADAERAVGDARRQAAADSAEAARSVRDARDAAREAEEDIASVRRQAARDLAEANRQVRDAQRDVTEAEKDARDVRKSLNEAIAEATQNMRELDTALKRNSLDQQKAVTAQKAALEDLNKLKMNPRATEVELRRAQDAYDEQTVRLLELQDKQKELAEQKRKYDKQGVEADEKVIAARKRIAEADQKLADAREKLSREQDQRREAEIQAQDRINDAQQRAAKAQEAVGRALLQQRETELRSNRRIADAERSVADARRQQARQRADGEYQIAQATNSLTQAQQAQGEAFKKAGDTSSAALENLQEKMDALSPAGQRFAKFIFGLKDEAMRLRAAAAEPLLPGLETAITMLLQYLPAVERFVGKVAGTLGELSIRAVQALGNPVWQRFFGYVDATAVPSLEQLFTIGQNLTEGLISLFLALTPFNEQVGTGLVDLSADFASWAEKLDRTQGFQDFLDYISENGPRVVHFLGEIGHLFIDLVEAAMPVGEVVLRVLTAIADGLNSLPDSALTALVIGIAAISAGFLALGGIMRVVKLKQQLSDIFGPRASAAVQKYGIETGRATAETGRFGKATATMGGLAAAAHDRVAGLGGAVRNLGAYAVSAQSLGPLARGMDVVRTTSLGAAAALNGPGGVAGAVQAAQGRVVGLASATEVAARQGMSRFRTAIQDVAVAANGPGGMAAGVQAAGSQLGGLARQAGTAATAVGGKLMSGLGSAAAFMGGPWGVALAGATIALGYFTTKSAEQKARVDTLKAALGQLSDEYKNLAGQGKAAGAQAEEALRNIVRQNPELQQAVIELDKLGISFDEMVRAVTSGDPSAVISKMNSEIDRLNKLIAQAENAPDELGLDIEAMRNQAKTLVTVRDAFDANARAIGRSTQAQDILTSSSERNVAMAKIQANATGASTAQLGQMATAWDTNQLKINTLNGILGNFGDKAGAATRRADDLTAAIKRQYGAAITANEANEKWSGTLLDLTESVAVNGRTLDINSRAGLANRDALQRAAQASRDMFIEEIRMGGKLPEVTKKHNDRITKLREEARRLGLTKTETDKLIRTYGEIDPSITTKYTTQNFDKVFKQAQQLQFAQIMLELGITDPKEAQARWNRQNAINTGNYPQGAGGRSKKATGGAIAGPGTSTSDDVLIWASNDEHMLTAAEVKAAGGHEAIYSWRRALMAERRIPAPWDIPEHATGGAIGRPQRATRKQLNTIPPQYQVLGYQGGGKIFAPFIVEMGGTKLPTMAQAIAAAEDRPGYDGSLGEGGGGRGYQWQMKTLRQQFPGLELISGFRKNSRTLSGNLSWHARGRAVDVPPKRKVAEWIASTYGKNTLELITPWRDLMLYKGRPHKYSPAVERQHGVGRAGNDHIHWAFDQGGWLPPGASQVVNQTGAPEPVLTSRQWQDISVLAQRATASGAGNTYQFEFRDTTLDAGKLRAMQDREAVMARQGRAR